ncbi:MAG: FAD-dependent oxidoreductase [Verrucomicrobiota bacterium]|nr:FAD-dependent oxidoreductase [Verrucomicrobiota bacterium]
MSDKENIAAVIALDTLTSARRRFSAPLFVDCTGHGTVGALAAAELTLRETDHLGMSNMWRWQRRLAAAPSPRSHGAGRVRVMKTGGMIGEVVGKAAAVCTKNQCSPREVLRALLRRAQRTVGAARGGAPRHVERRDPPA